MLVKPRKIFVFFLTLLMLVVLLSLLFPRGGIHLSDDIVFRFPDFKQLAGPPTKPYKEIDEITRAMEQPTASPSYLVSLLFHHGPVFYQLRYDTLLGKKVQHEETHKPPPYRAYQPIQKSIQYPGGDPSLLYPLFQSLQGVRGQETVYRVLHYGDSQIEGDRITSYIRDQLQKRFGGSGVGMFPVKRYSRFMVSINMEISGNWARYSIGDYQKGNIPHNRLGAMMSFCRFSPVWQEERSPSLYEGSIQLEKTAVSYHRATNYTTLKLFYGYNQKPLVIELYKNEQRNDADILLPNQELCENEWDLNVEGDKTALYFKGEDSPDIYGIALDGPRGIAVDNIPLRGSRGLDFTKSDRETIRQMYHILQVKFLILQFGVNMVPMVRENYQFYEDSYYRQLVFLKNLMPDLPVLVMGVSDMSRKEKGKYVSYPNVEKIRDAQRGAAFRAGCAFWDTYVAMGGEHSMPSWVFHDPPLAQKDFTHFTYRGSKLIAKMFYESLMADFNEYIRHTQ